MSDSLTEMVSESELERHQLKAVPRCRFRHSTLNFQNKVSDRLHLVTMLES